MLIRRLLVRTFSAIFSALLWLLTFKRVRSWLWRRVTRPPKAGKVIDAEGKVIE
ncbi:hypothetical protein HYS28_03290 [Candidatus Uhrbacteria bacterium]|nr:hypothetical protein [Candidatus Uhrbacteria bacterium]